MFIYRILDIFFVILHLIVIIFNLLGWIYKPTRKWNLILLLLTGLSWSVLGIFYGFGYCPLTDWHWDILEKSGKMPTEDSYTQYLFNRISGMSIRNQLADSVTLVAFLIALGISLILNIIDLVKRKNRLY